MAIRLEIMAIRLETTAIRLEIVAGRALPSPAGVVNRAQDGGRAPSPAGRRAQAVWLRQETSMSLVESRRDQIFPVLDVAQIETARRFASGARRHFGPGETEARPIRIMASHQRRSPIPASTGAIGKAVVA